MAEPQQQPEGTQQREEVATTSPGGGNPEPGENPGPGGKKDDKVFMATACLVLESSKDPKTKVGACVVNQKKEIIGIGYNKMPNGTEGLKFSDDEDGLENKHLYVCHAELNAIMDVNSGKLNGCTIYTTQFPCNECAKIIIQAGISKVIYLSDDYYNSVEALASERMFDLAKVECSPSLLGEIPKDLPEFFMGKARSAAQRSEDPNAKEGACIVNKRNKIIGTGYNKMPNGTEGLQFSDDEDGLENKHFYECHAELNAIIDTYMDKLNGCTIYSTLFPCCDCAKIIIQGGMKDVVYITNKHMDKPKMKASSKMFESAGLTPRRYPPPQDDESAKVLIDFKSIYGPGELEKLRAEQNEKKEG